MIENTKSQILSRAKNNFIAAQIARARRRFQIKSWSGQASDRLYLDFRLQSFLMRRVNF
jgi:hypothetical protein